MGHLILYLNSESCSGKVSSETCSTAFTALVYGLPYPLLSCSVIRGYKALSYGFHCQAPLAYYLNLLLKIKNIEMGCCGTKRSAWRNKVKSEMQREEQENTNYATIENKKDSIFEYLGAHSLRLRGASSGKHYLFRYTGEQLKVDYMDSFAMMAEKDLKIISTK